MHCRNSFQACSSNAMANHESNDEWSGPSEKKSKQDRFTNDCVPSTRQSAIPNEDIDWEAISLTADFARLATSTPPGLGRGVLRRPETPGRVRDGKRWIYAFTTPSPNQGRLDDIDPWERDERAKTTTTAGRIYQVSGNLKLLLNWTFVTELNGSTKLTSGQPNFRDGKKKNSTPRNGTSWS